MEKIKDELIKVLAHIYTSELVSIVISGSKQKGGNEKIKIRPVLIQGDSMYQASIYKENKVFHENLNREQMIHKMIGWMQEDFKQAQIKKETEEFTLLMSKKGRVTLTGKKKTSHVKKEIDHNRTKRYILEEGIPVGFLIDLGVMCQDGTIRKAKYDKFRQVNRYLEFVEDVLPVYDAGSQIKVIDFGCGKSYLTFALYYFLKVLRGFDVHITGLDLKEDVIADCCQLSEKYGYEGLTFQKGDIATYDGTDSVDLVVSLHACDTATDYALYKAVKWGAKVILTVPCCHHELNSQINSEILNPVLQFGIIKERTAALFTDALRAQLLMREGYGVQILEFIAMEHTPKNLLIRAVKGKSNKFDEEAYQMCRSFLTADPMLKKLLDENEIQKG